MTRHTCDETPTSWDELPAPITAYLTPQNTRDVASAIAAFTGDAVVIDEGRRCAGREEIRAWLVSATGGYTFSTDFTRATTLDGTRVDVEQHLEGDFPGGVVDLIFRFTMDGALISRLVIEPSSMR